MLAREIVKDATGDGERFLVDAAPCGLSGDSLDAPVAPAFGNVGRPFEWLCVLWPQVLNHFDDFGDDVPRFLQHHRIADADIKTVYLILIMKCRARDGRTCD